MLSLETLRNLELKDSKNIHISMVSQPTSLLEILAIELLSIMNSQMMWLFSPKNPIHSIKIKSITSFPLNVSFTL